MTTDTVAESILTDIDQLGVLFSIQFDLIPAKKLPKDIAHFAIFMPKKGIVIHNGHENIELKGIAASSTSKICGIKVVEKNRGDVYSARVNLPSEKFGRNYPHIPASDRAAWQCEIDTRSSSSYALYVSSENGSEHFVGSVSFEYLNAVREQKTSPGIEAYIEGVKQSRLVAQEHTARGKKYLIVTGNPRSGTTSLGRLVNSSMEVFLGIERYAKFNLASSAFEKDAFIAEGSQAAFKSAFLSESTEKMSLSERYDKATYIGDKRPGFALDWRSTMIQMPNMKIVYIFRDIMGVASSYNVRAQKAAQGKDSNWHATRNYSQAVKEWNYEMSQACQMAKFVDIYFVKYEDFFCSTDKMQLLFEHLNVDGRNADVISAIRAASVIAKRKQHARPELNDTQRSYIEENADYTEYKKLHKLYEQQFLH